MVLKILFIILVFTSSGVAFGEMSTLTKYCINGTCITSPQGNLTNSIIHESRPHYDIIMVMLSEACEKAIANNVKTDCPAVQDLEKYDTSNQNISGFFFSPDGNKIVRSNPEVKNHWQYYNSPVVCVECVGNYVIPDLYNTIIIEPKNFTYVSHDYYSKNELVGYIANGTDGVIPFYSNTNQISAGFTIYGERYISPNCYSATIAYSDSLLNDTINYMKSGCKKTSFDNVKGKTILHDSPWDYNNPFSSLKYKAVINHIKNTSTVDCRYHDCSQTTSTKKW